MTKSYKLTESEIPECRSQSLYADIVAAFLAKGAETMKVTPEGLKVATLRVGLRRGLKGNEEVRLAQRGEETFLVRKVHTQPRQLDRS